MTKSTRATDQDYPVLTGAALVTLQRWVDGLQPFYQSLQQTSDAADQTSDGRKVRLRRPVASARRLHPGSSAAKR